MSKLTMEVENNNSNKISTCANKEGDQDHDDHVQLPGFRFHPTDEELVGFYLRRKIEKRSISIELIKQADIYKYDPWDLPKSGNVGDKEWYFFCKRGRKYRNSIRPNRVTGSGFWKATGIDKPIYSSGPEERRDCIGLKKSLVYYRGSAGKGTKTDWMMHEFRLPASHDKSVKHIDTTKSVAQEAEVWTLCRIFKRNVSYRRCLPDFREVAANRSIINPISDASSKTCSMDSSDHHYISFNAPTITQTHEKKPYSSGHAESNINIANQQLAGHYSLPLISQAPSSSLSYSSSICGDINDQFFRQTDWDDLRSIVECANYNPFFL